MVGTNIAARRLVADLRIVSRRVSLTSSARSRRAGARSAPRSSAVARSRYVRPQNGSGVSAAILRNASAARHPDRCSRIASVELGDDFTLATTHDILDRVDHAATGPDPHGKELVHRVDLDAHPLPSSLDG